MPAPGQVEHYQTWKNTQYREKAPGSPDETFNEDNDRSMRDLYTPWATRWQAVMDIVGFSSRNFSEVGGGQWFLHRDVPMQHDDFPGYLYANAVQKVTGMFPDPTPGPNGVGSFDEALMSVVYTAPTYNVMTDEDLAAASPFGWPDEASLLRYVSPTFKASGKYQTLPPFSALKWVAAGGGPYQPMSAIAAVLLIEGDLEITWHQVPVEAIPWTAIKACVGCTNSADFGTNQGVVGSIVGILSQRTLVMGFPVPKYYRMKNGKFAADINYKFKYFPFGANSFFRHDINPPRYQAASRDGVPENVATNSIFPDADFNSLFRVEVPS